MTSKIHLFYCQIKESARRVDLLYLQINNLITLYNITKRGSRRSILKCKCTRTTILDRCNDCV